MRRGAHLLFQVIFLFLCLNPAFALTPYKEMLSDPLEFRGYQSAAGDLSELDHIAIGLFLPDGSKDPAARAITEGALLAVETANDSGGYNNLPFELRRRWDDNPWGAGSVEMTRLAYSDRVLAVIGFLSGSGHIAEQIAARAYLPVITPVASDPTLTHARLPWIFRLPPETGIQARMLVDKGLAGLKPRRPGLVTATDHDGRIAAKEFRQEMERGGFPPAFHLAPAPDVREVRGIVSEIKSFSPDSLIVHLPPHLIPLLLDELRISEIDCPVFIPWIPGLSTAELHTSYSGSIVIAEPFEHSPENSRHAGFSRAYTERFGSSPSPEAAYGFDAAEMIIAAIRNGGMNRSSVRNALASLSGYEGASGIIQWDNGGGNQAVPVIRVLTGHGM